MTIQDWQSILSVIIATAAVAGIVFTILRFYIKAFAKQELDEIKKELKPNGGASLKDQVTRLEKVQTESIERQKQDDIKFEQRLDKLDSKIDDLFKIIIDKLGH